MLPAVRSVPAGGSGECESATAWTGEKRRKTTCPSPLGSPDDATDMMDIQLQEGQGGGRGGGQRHPPEDNEIGDEELNLCLRKVKSRKPTIFLPTATMINNLRKIEELHQRFHQLRMEEYSKFKNLADTNAPTAGIYPLDHFHHWCHSPFIGWAMNDEIFNVAGLSDYQRIIPITSATFQYLISKFAGHKMQCDFQCLGTWSWGEQSQLGVPSSNDNLPLNQSSHDLDQMLISPPFNRAGNML
ncbi:uncharacterized protein LOC112898008 isoform X1 [Panicum hallii]|uniref:uncharacterized protein LOC112898008 isoform X1 n=1 Tax=Panicum hallii TaxID=206008 RepID=UPI000DF4CBD7|nr:uncharacterized protein LOC112898008 isoform X1 [Panicum hallii]